jgi:hypothetical protein
MSVPDAQAASAPNVRNREKSLSIQATGMTFVMIKRLFGSVGIQSDRFLPHTLCLTTARAVTTVARRVRIRAEIAGIG